MPNQNRRSQKASGGSIPSGSWLIIGGLISIFFTFVVFILNSQTSEGRKHAKGASDRYIVLNDHIDGLAHSDLANPPDLMFVDGMDLSLDRQDAARGAVSSPGLGKVIAATAHHDANGDEERLEAFCSSQRMHNLVSSVRDSGFRGLMVILVAHSEGTLPAGCLALQAYANDDMRISFFHASLDHNSPKGPCSLSAPPLQLYRAVNSYFTFNDSTSASILQTRFAKAAMIRPLELLWCGRPLDDVIGNMKAVSMIAVDTDEANQHLGTQPSGEKPKDRWWRRNIFKRKRRGNANAAHPSVGSSDIIYVDDFVGSSVVGLHRFVKSILALAINSTDTESNGETLVPAGTYTTNCVSSLIKRSAGSRELQSRFHQYLRPLMSAHHHHYGEAFDNPYSVISKPSECSPFMPRSEVNGRIIGGLGSLPKCPPSSDIYRKKDTTGGSPKDSEGSPIRLVARTSNCHGLLAE